MKYEDLLEHKAQLTSKLEAVEFEKAQLVRKLKAIDILLEGSDLGVFTSSAPVAENPIVMLEHPRVPKARKRVVPAHAVRISPRSSLIDAVKEVAMKQPGSFESGQLLKALQSEYPEFKLTETKHISSPLSDLVKKGVLTREQKRSGSKSNIYRALNAK